MIFKLLTDESYDYVDSNIEERLIKATRPYGYTPIKYGSLEYLIPLRSHLKTISNNKKQILIYEQTDDYCKGLDFTKAIIINENINTKDINFELTNREEFNFYNEREEIIKNNLEITITKYITICEKIKKTIQLNQEININTLKRVIAPYRYSTLINYHSELGIELTKQEMTEIKEKVYGQ